MRLCSLALCALVLSSSCGESGDARPEPADPRAGGSVAAVAGAVHAGADTGSTGPGATEASAGSEEAPGPARLRLPPSNGGLDYQLGGAYAPASGVAIVSRDRTEKPAAGLYNICYVNGFQAQPGERDFWLQQQPDLILRDKSSKPVIDKDWNEMLLDVGTDEKRKRLAAIIGGWIAGCAADGFDAVEVDNLDSYARSGGRLQSDDAVAFIALLSRVAHQHKLAIAQKNSSELVNHKGAMGTDFVVAEECSLYDECDTYRQSYGEHVLMIEYEQADFEKGCASYPNDSVVLRDRDLVGKGRAGYVFDDC